MKEPTPGDIGVGSRPGRCGEAWGLDQSLTLNRAQRMPAVLVRDVYRTAPAGLWSGT